MENLNDLPSHIDWDYMLSRAKRDRKTGCLEWQACRVKDSDTGLLSYGQVSRHKFVTHRVSWVLNRGTIPKGLYVCHKCDNRPCVEPRHLFLGTATDNMQDCISKGRRPLLRIAVPGERNGSAKLTERQVLEIRKSRLQGKDLATKYRVSRALISCIVNNKRWGWLT